MNMLLVLGIIGGGALLVMVIIFGLLVSQARKIDLDDVPPDEKPEWIESTIPEETRQATQEDGEGVTLYDHDPGEDLASPFAEQIEDLLRAEIRKDPQLSGVDVDFGTGPDGGIEFHIGGETYTSVEQIPDQKLQKAIRKVIADYNRER